MCIRDSLIAGLPGDSVEGFCKTGDEVIALQPENVTVHTLSIKRSASYGESWEERRKALEQAQQVGQKMCIRDSYWHDNGVGTYIALNSNDISEMRTVENEYQDILTIGKIFDVEDKAQQLVDKMKAEVEKVTSQAKGMEKKSVLIVELMSDTIWTYDETYLAGDMVKSMGGDLINTCLLYTSRCV